MNGDATYVSSVIHNATFAWGSDSFTTPSHFGMVVYELHVPTMDPSTPQGVSTFQQLIQKLDYLQHLGVNIVEPLPIATFPTNARQWGYDPGAPFTVMTGPSRRAVSPSPTPAHTHTHTHTQSTACGHCARSYV